MYPTPFLPNMLTFSSSSSSGSSGTSVHLPSFLSPDIDVHERFIELTRLQHERCARLGVIPDESGSDPRNRYGRIQPFQYNRILLRDLEDSYINASPINIDDQRFIACQGPLEERLIWHMIWQENISVVVMLTLPVENEEEKCFPYYPSEPFDVVDTPDFRITLLAKTHENRADIRKILMAHTNGEKRIVWHYLFHGWPDYGVPTSTDEIALISLMNLSAARNHITNPTAPRLIHCSAGCGRTGTFIALDHLLSQMDRTAFADESTLLQDSQMVFQMEHDPIFECVDRLRIQRMHMVWNEEQLSFIYRVLRERWYDRYYEERARRVDEEYQAHRWDMEEAGRRLEDVPELEEGEPRPRTREEEDEEE